MPYRAVFHLDDASSCRISQVLGNIGNLLDDLGPEGLEVELVAHSDGLAALYGEPNPHRGTIEELAGRGVRFAACRKTMASRGVAARDLLPLVQLVSSGVGQLVRRQAEGWVYVRP